MIDSVVQIKQPNPSESTLIHLAGGKLVTMLPNDPLCLNAPEPAFIPVYQPQSPSGTSPTDSTISCTLSSPSPASPVGPPPPPYQSPPHDADKEPWKVRLLRLIGNLAIAPTRLLASTSTSQRAQVWLGLIGLGVGGYYYYESYLVSFRSLALSQKAYEMTMWKDCRDRPHISNTSVCHRFAGVMYDSIAKRDQFPDVVGMLIGTSRPVSLQESPVHTSCQSQVHELGLFSSPTRLLCLLNAASWPLYCAAKVVTLCALVYVYAIKMTPIKPAKDILSESIRYSALLCVALSFLMGCWQADAHTGAVKSQWQFVLKGVVCFHWGFAWYRLLHSTRSPLLLLKSRLVWRNSSFLTLSTDILLFVLTAIFFAHIISSTISGMRIFPTSGLLWVHLPLLTVLYAAGKALRVHAYVNKKCKTTFDDEAQEEREVEAFRESPLVESVRDLSLWLCQCSRRKQHVRNCA